MNLIDEVYGEVILQAEHTEIEQYLAELKEKQLSAIEDIKNKISAYEQKKRREEAMYQSLSPFRKFFTGRPPAHHQAVENMVFVKERFKKIELLKQLVRHIEALQAEMIENSAKEEISLPLELREEILLLQKRRKET
ncbi:hypothetical protein LRR81_15000 [Metabacillus sp. GX 13764]|uniref:hypothetical protein n=1 Tax=Metabacillus kandeliae TaxID=2900151 RepID=UPI001E4FE128|nr:hypothetical protein [Metabacillus kandeliae]MCD7035552.1 hypothetical protein [Metabacillus kandeliae]